MSTDGTFYLALLGMALASFGCRIAGFLLMGYVPITVRLRSALQAVPLAVMIGIVMPVLSAGRPPEIVALAVVLVTQKLTGSNAVAALSGAATVALFRWLAKTA
ncbi:MAG: AzlD domain-containing protein [Burkholderiaceae bacterium]|nr:AzlD domain-containing protein [Burkholderiaceae bacterium]MDO9090090.1 AzlD domain-containing protein [Burkholderiaceae bacterium]MDP1969138.1 AzlD domain-containing protein [Burkholderiaceae bacterium]